MSKTQLSNYLIEQYENGSDLDALMGHFQSVSSQSTDYGDFCDLEKLTISELEKICHAYRLETQGPKIRIIRRIIRHYDRGNEVLSHRNVPEGGPSEAQLRFVASLRTQLKDENRTSVPPILVYLNKFRASEWIDVAQDKIKQTKAKTTTTTYIGGR